VCPILNWVIIISRIIKRKKQLILKKKFLIKEKRKSKLNLSTASELGKVVLVYFKLEII